MCIYFIQADQGGLIKIGYSANPVNRLYNLQMSCPIPLKILATIKDAPQTSEGYVHTTLGNSRQYGEWFLPSIEVLTYMRDKAIKFELPPTPRFDDEDIVTINTREYVRCKGYSLTTQERCKNPIPGYGQGDYCSRHKP